MSTVNTGVLPPGRVYSGTDAPVTGLLPGVVDMSVLGGDAWNWMLLGPMATP